MEIILFHHVSYDINNIDLSGEKTSYILHVGILSVYIYTCDYMTKISLYKYIYIYEVIQ